MLSPKACERSIGKERCSCYKRTYATPNTQVYNDESTEELNDKECTDYQFLYCVPGKAPDTSSGSQGAIRSDTQVAYLNSTSGHIENDGCLRLIEVNDVHDGPELAFTELIMVKALMQEAQSATGNTRGIYSLWWRRSTEPPM